jgi:hypothetical protein
VSTSTYSCPSCGGTGTSRGTCCGQQMGTYAEVAAALAVAADTPLLNSLLTGRLPAANGGRS